ncbi:hypothetical protein D3C72_1628940 [compost metagenome]
MAPVLVRRHQFGQPLRRRNPLLRQARADATRSDHDYLEAKRGHLPAKTVIDRFHSILCSRINSETGHGDFAAKRTDIDHAPAAVQQGRGKRLNNRDLPDHADFDLAAKFIKRNHLKRCINGDAGIVDHGSQGATKRILLHPFGQRL